MKFLLTILKRLIPRELPSPLGRWKIDYCSKKTDHKIDLSNEDHCGPCGQYALTKLKKNSQDNMEKK